VGPIHYELSLVLAACHSVVGPGAEQGVPEMGLL